MNAQARELLSACKDIALLLGEIGEACNCDDCPDEDGRCSICALHDAIRHAEQADWADMLEESFLDRDIPDDDPEVEI